jgi:PRTRC genetic system ThiF family protein
MSSFAQGSLVGYDSYGDSSIPLGPSQLCWLGQDSEEMDRARALIEERLMKAGEPGYLKDMIKEKEENRMYTSIENPPLSEMGSLSFVSTLTPRLATRKKFLIIIAGVGGTGGYVVRDLSRFLYSIKERDDKYDFKFLLVDPDTVEEKNLLRQNFLPSDLGKNKAETMASKHARAFGLEIGSVEQLLTKSLLAELVKGYKSDYIPIVIGCIDNNKARREIHNYMLTMSGRTVFWIDSGNERSSGQVIMGTSKGVPMVTSLYPEILEETSDSTSEISCAERLMQDEQNIFINTRAAGHVLDFVRSIVLNETSPVHGVKFNINGRLDTLCLKEAA